MKTELYTVLRRNPVVFPLSCVAAVAMLFISEGSYWQSVGRLDDLGAMGAARTGIQGLQQGIQDADTGQQAYLLSGRKEPLELHDRALGEIDRLFKQLEQHYSAEPQALALLQQMQVLTDARLQQLAATLGPREPGRRGGDEVIVGAARGAQQVAEIRALGDRLLEHESAKVAQRRNDLYHTLTLSRIGVAALSAISLLALFMYLRQSLALDKQRREQQRLVQVESNRLEVEVVHRTAQLTELTHHLQTAREDERSRLARNLHDELGALLTSAKLDAARIRSRLIGVAPEALERLEHLVGTLNSSIALGRRIIEDLQPSTLSNLGLVATLEILARDFAERSGLAVHCSLAAVHLEATAELMVYRLVQEAITNTTKYARASQAWLTLDSIDGQVEVSVRDNGVGFDTGAKAKSAYGLVGMRFRVEAEGGTMAVTSAPGQGTLIRVSLPQAQLIAA
jgi:signal transduction histidine kinase